MLEALLELEYTIFDSIIEDEEKTVSDIAAKYKVKKEELLPYFNLFMMYKLDSEKDLTNTQGKRSWSKSEKEIVLQYMVDTHNKKSKKIAFKELAELLEPTKRTHQSIQFEYYNRILKKEHKVEKVEKPKVVKREEKQEKTSLPNHELLSQLTAFMQNAKKLEKFDLTNLFAGLNQLTELAAGKFENTEESEQLKSELVKRDELIEQQRLEIEKLKKDLSGVRDAIAQFDALDGMDKIINLKEYSTKLRYMVDKFGNVVTIRE